MSHITAWTAIAILIGFGAWVAVTLFALASFNNFRIRIYSAHRDLWRELGGNDGFELGSGARDNAFYYCISRRYRAVGDAELTKLGNRALIALGIQAACFAVAAYFWMSWSWA